MSKMTSKVACENKSIQDYFFKRNWHILHKFSNWCEDIFYLAKNHVVKIQQGKLIPKLHVIVI